jgi:acetyltransferase-like isoleucine patch superfamily enzyme
MSREDIFIHDMAHVSDKAEIGENSKIWINAQIRENSKIGKGCIISKDTYIDTNVTIGNNCKIQNGVSIYQGVTIEDDVFIGPNVTFTNDKIPRAFNGEWKITPTLIKRGASIGANATIVCGVVVGEYSMVGAGAVVTKDVAPYTLVVGNPARYRYHIDKMGNRLGDENG